MTFPFSAFSLFAIYIPAGTPLSKRNYAAIGVSGLPLTAAFRQSCRSGLLFCVSEESILGRRYPAMRGTYAAQWLSSVLFLGDNVVDGAGLVIDTGMAILRVVSCCTAQQRLFYCRILRQRRPARNGTTNLHMVFFSSGTCCWAVNLALSL